MLIDCVCLRYRVSQLYEPENITSSPKQDIAQYLININQIIFFYKTFSTWKLSEIMLYFLQSEKSDNYYKAFLHQLNA